MLKKIQRAAENNNFSVCGGGEIATAAPGTIIGTRIG